MADTPRDAEVDALASQVFKTLAKGEEAITLEDFKRCATILAEVSEDFAADPSQAFGRMDQNGDFRVDLHEFLHEVQNIGRLVGMRKVTVALEEVRRVAAQFGADLEGLDGSDRGTSPARGNAGANRPTGGKHLVPKPGSRPGGNLGADAGGMDLGLGIQVKQKPLHIRGQQQRGRKASLQAREKVIENMLVYFKSLREDYERKLQSVKGQRDALAGKEEVMMRFSARGEPHGLQIAGAVAAAGELSQSRICGVAAGSQAETKGVEVDWVIDKVNGQDYSAELLASAQSGDEDYFVTFFKAAAAGDAAAATASAAEEPKRVFAGMTARPKLDASSAAKEEEEEEEGEEEEGEDEDEGAKGQGAEDGDEAEDGEDEPGDEEEEGEDEEEDEDAEEEGGEEGAEGEEGDEDEDEGDGEDEEGEERELPSSKAKTPKGKGQEPGASSSSAAQPSSSSSSAPPAAAAQPEPASSSSAPAQASGSLGGTVAATKSKKTKKAKAKKPKEEAPPKKETRPRVPPAPRPARATTPTERASPEPKEEVQVRDVPPRDISTSKGRGKLDEEGVSCMQTLDLGLAIRSAICIGREVWCADWKGQVTIRERDDASKVKSEIPTNRFIWCMAHQEPGLLWMGMEFQGISLFSTGKKEFKSVLTGGHGGGVTCLAVDEALGDEEAGLFPVRRGWSGSNDFTIRQWWIETWLSKGAPPEKVRAAPSKYNTVNLGRISVGIAPGLSMHGHTNGVRALIRIGPSLWSGGDEGAIRIWSSADGVCTEVIDDAHKGSVLKLAVVRSNIWSAGMDGLIKEWQLGGEKTRCIRQVSPPGSERGVYAIVPMGKEVWSCGHHPNIRVLTQTGMEQVEEYEAHTPYVSNLLAVDRVETKILWSTSLGDRKLKVWRHTIRGNVPNMDELKAANALYEKESQSGADKLGRLVEEINQLQAQLDVAGSEYKGQLDDLARQLAEEQAAREELEARKRFLEEEMEGLRRLFEEAGLGHLLQDPEALRRFLDIKRLFDEAGLGRLLQDPDALKKFLGLGKVLEELGLGRFLEDPEGLKAFLKRAADIEEVLRSLGLEDCLNHPGRLREILTSFQQLKKVLEDFGLGDALKDPSILTEILSRYMAMKQAFSEHGFPELFEDPYSLKGFLRNYARIREEFRNVNLEYLMDSAPAMRDFLAKSLKGQEDLKAMQELKDKLDLLERTLAKCTKDLASAREELEAARSELAQYKEICPTLDELRKMKEEAGQFKTLKKLKKAQEKELEDLRKLLEEKERERLEALERERMMALKYKELDIFKLDIIARELKALDNELNMVGKAGKSLITDANRLKNYEEQQQILPHGEHIVEQCKDLRGHIRDVINKCLSETQKMHVGVAIEDPLAAGHLQDGGVMSGYVVEEVDRPDYGNSRAAKLRQQDELSREADLRRGALPQIPPGRRSPGPRG